MIHRMLLTAATAALAGLVALAPAAAAPQVEPLVSADWLKAHLGRDDVVVLDIRSPYTDSGREDYLKGHIPGAVWSEYPGIWRTTRDGVEGMLPSVDKLEANLSELGVGEETAVIIVPAGKDSLEFSGATRIYWTLKQLGHDAVAILDGGYRAWNEAGFALESGDVTPIGNMFIAEPREDLFTSTDDVAKMSRPAILLDARPLEFFVGKKKHDQAARPGRLAGSVNLDQDRFFDVETGRLKPRPQLELIAADVLPDRTQPIVSYCNSGHWAAADWFVLHELLGYEQVSLYDASMVGWTADPARPVVTGEAVHN